MIESSAQIRELARNSMANQWLDACISIILVALIGLILSPFFILIFGIAIFAPFAYRLDNFFLLNSKYEPVDPSFLWHEYNEDRRDLGMTYIKMYIYLTAWSVLFIIPGLIKHYSYAMVPYIMYEKPSVRGDHAIDASREMMNGHKMELFLLDLSFIGWAILAIIPAGLGFIPLMAYMKQAHAEFYLKLCEEEARSNMSAEQFLLRKSAQPDHGSPIDAGSLNMKLNFLNNNLSPKQKYAPPPVPGSVHHEESHRFDNPVNMPKIPPRR